MLTIYMSHDMMVHKAHKRLKMRISHFHNNDEDLPHIGRTSGMNPEDSKNLHGVNAGTNTPRTPCATMISPKKREFSPLGEEANMHTCKRASATLTALRAGSDTPEEVPEPHYSQGTSHLVQDTDKNGSNSCWRRELFVAPRNVEKSSTSSRVSCETSSLQYSSKPVHSPVYATGRYTKQSNDNSCSRREPFLIAKNVENTSTSLLPSHDDSETSSSPPRRKPVQIPVYKTGNHTKPSCDDPRLCREPVLSGKNVEKTSTLPSPSHCCSYFSSFSIQSALHIVSCDCQVALYCSYLCNNTKVNSGKSSLVHYCSYYCN